MNKIVLTLLAPVLIFAVSCTQKEAVETDYTQFVDPYIGSDYHGHVFVGANVPFGMVQLGPNNETQGWDWCSGYHYSDSILIGFAHTHLSGTGIGDLGDVVFMPVSDAYNPEEDADSAFNWKSTYSHNHETVEPGFYSLHIDRYNIDAELTTSERVGFHKYNFNDGGNSHLIIDLQYGTGWDMLTDGALEQVDEFTVKGQRLSQGWANDQQVFFYTTFSKEISDFRILKENEKQGSVTALIEFEGNGELLAKTALSPVSTNGAKANLTSEIDHWNFKQVQNEAKEKWNNELSKINIETGNAADKRTFYTALYHTMIAPSLFSDVNGDYRGADREVHQNPGHDTYTTLSLWDTYRAAHPLFTLVQQERVNDFINTMLDIYKQQGKLPIWHLHGNETNTMVGYSAVPVIADAYFKGFRGFDTELAFEAMKTSALLDERGLDYIKSQGFIPADSQVESVARAMEYAISDWAIAAMAKDMGKTGEAERFSKRAKYYQNYFDESTGFMRGKLSDQSWRSPFNPISSQHRTDDYCEGNAWQYTWLVPHDVEGLINLFGSEEAFTTKLDSLFSIESIKVEGASADITGLIGQYAHGNEPSHHTTYLYAYAGQQWKTAEKVREICTTMYHDQPDGLCGNEDCGQMSAWYVLSSMGFYPVNPSNGAYIFGSPLFDEVAIDLPEDKTFTIVAENNSKQNIYIRSVELNGEPYEKTFITHDTIIKGGTLTFLMGSEPNADFGKAPENRPKSIVY
ncbi:alpha-1,2-mannosidase, putative [Tangfeifania diversioriginum]|uniref:Alpha-1,2-mannosidase, putative n=1 Tax=Tangfeifania diversioriginum TaxID=1168035 RepID=A0A1M6E6N2_9BACT|nr:GH92 family glycosyl hydrolase [Tangfeifania diversioriginum]SHI81204.1 alpha-1,2-mannosidase, putative [Tangfeifania diversioriginum]